MKREGAAAKLMERFEDILAKKEEACVKRSGINEEKKSERFKLLIEVTGKKFKLDERRTIIEEREVVLEENKVKIAGNAEDTKMLTLTMDSLDADSRMIVQSVCYRCCIGRKISWPRRTMRTPRRRRQRLSMWR